MEAIDSIVWLLCPSMNSPWEEGTDPTARTEQGMRRSLQEGKQRLEQSGMNVRNNTWIAWSKHTEGQS